MPESPSLDKKAISTRNGNNGKRSVRFQCDESRESAQVTKSERGFYPWLPDEYRRL